MRTKNLLCKVTRHFGALACAVFCFLLNVSAYHTGHRQFTFTDNTRNNRQVPVEVYYPSVTSGDNVPVAESTFPLIVFGHGYMMAWGSYSNFADTLSQAGYIIAFLTTESSLVPSTTDYAKDFAFVAQSVNLENGKADSPFFRRLNGRVAAAGHSMGGGCAILSSEYYTNFDAYILFAPLNITPSTGIQAAKISVPVLIYSAGKDCITPPAQNQQPIYDSIRSGLKTMISITGGSHCQFAGSDFYCTLGESACLQKPSVTSETQQKLTFSTFLPWLDFVMKGNVPAGVRFQQLLSASSGISVVQSMPITSLGLVRGSKYALKVFPQHSPEMLTIEVDPVILNGEYLLLDLTGKIILRGKLANTFRTEVQIVNITSGIYIVQVVDKSTGIYSTKIALVH